MKNRLKELRQLHQWSQSDLARELGVSRQSVFHGFACFLSSITLHPDKIDCQVWLDKSCLGAFVIGPDGHNIEAVCHEPEA